MYHIKTTRAHARLPSKCLCPLQGHQSGQASIEYVLLLVVVVALIGGAIWQLNDAFRQWGNQYFGNYIACLIETGELPSLGHENSNQQAQGCNQEFEEFSLANGRPLIARTGQGNRSNSSSRGPTSSNRSANNRARPQGGRKSPPSQATDGSHSSSRQGGARFAARSSGGTGPKASGSTTTASKSKNNADESGGSGSKNPKVQNINAGGKGRVASQSRFDRAQGISGGNLENDAQNRPGGRVQALPDGSLPDNKKNKLIAVSKAPGKVPELDIQPIGIGGWLRYLLIAAILIVLLLVLGGQALKLQKSLQGE